MVWSNDVYYYFWINNGFIELPSTFREERIALMQAKEDIKSIRASDFQKMQPYAIYDYEFDHLIWISPFYKHSPVLSKIRDYVRENMIP